MEGEQRKWEREMWNDEKIFFVLCGQWLFDIWHAKRDLIEF